MAPAMLDSLYPPAYTVHSHGSFGAGGGVGTQVVRSTRWRHGIVAITASASDSTHNRARTLPCDTLKDGAASGRTWSALSSCSRN
jgi:hypothetical protein